MNRIVHTRPDGSVSIEILADGADIKAALAFVPADSINVHECLATDIPSDRTFRDAFAQTGKSPPSVNMPKARTIHMDRIRVARNAKLAEKDAEFMRALEDGDVPGQNRIKGEKQKLRDLPVTFDLEQHATPEALKAAWPAAIERRASAR